MGYKKSYSSGKSKDDKPKRAFSGKKSYSDKPAFRERDNKDRGFSKDKGDKPGFRPRSSDRDSRSNDGERKPFRRAEGGFGKDKRRDKKSAHSPRNPRWEARPDFKGKTEPKLPRGFHSRENRADEGEERKPFRRPDSKFADKKRPDDSRPSYKDFKREDRPERNSGDERPPRENFSRDERRDDSERKPFRRSDSKFGDKRRGDSSRPSFEDRKHKWGDKPDRTSGDEPRTPREGFSGDSRSDDRERKPFRKSESKFGDRPRRDDSRPFLERGERRPGGDRRSSRDAGSGDGEKKWNRKADSEFYGDRRKSAPRSGGFRKKSFSKSTAEDDGTTRLNKFISNAGICSRREADEMIEAGVVSVNGEVVIQLGYKVKPEDVVKYNNEVLKSEKMVYLLLNKPKDFITTAEDPEKRKTVMNLIVGACKERIYPVGRLDRNTTGLLLMTNDGDLTRKLTHPSFEVQKIYQVELDSAVKPSDMEAIEKGIHLEDGFVKVDAVSYVGTGQDKAVVGVELHSGRNRIVRRIFEHLGYEVRKLDRVYFAGISKKDLPRGRWRFLTDLEVASLKIMTGSKKFKNLAPVEEGELE